MNERNPRAMVREMRESAGIARTEIEQAIGSYKDSLRRFEFRTGPLSEKDQRILLKYTQALCTLATGCDYPGRMKRLREAKGMTHQEAAKAAGLACVTDWRRVECGGNKTTLLQPQVRARLDAILNRWHEELLTQQPEAAE